MFNYDNCILTLTWKLSEKILKICMWCGKRPRCTHAIRLHRNAVEPAMQAVITFLIPFCILHSHISSSKLQNTHKFWTELNHHLFATSNSGFALFKAFFLPCYYIHSRIIFWHILYLFCGFVFVCFIFSVCTRFIILATALEIIHFFKSTFSFIEHITW